MYHAKLTLSYQSGAFNVRSLCLEISNTSFDYPVLSLIAFALALALDSIFTTCRHSVASLKAISGIFCDLKPFFVYFGVFLLNKATKMFINY